MELVVMRSNLSFRREDSNNRASNIFYFIFFVGYLLTISVSSLYSVLNFLTHSWIDYDHKGVQ
jgi:hypothetical protein